jgi:excinuclease ABC subunit C
MNMDSNNTSSRMQKLHAEAMQLPERPGVYIMRDASDKIIYVGKSRNLKNRVSQYFGNNEKNAKTARMVASVRRFECIHCDTEIEALTLENTLIKQHTPRYNIRLKDAKSYPFIKLTGEEYPRLVMTRKRLDDGGRYFGPYSGTQSVFSVISFMNKTFGLYSCKRKFPADFGKGRPCINYQMGHCPGVCTGKITRDEYAQRVNSVAEVLRGNTAKVRRQLEDDMFRFAEEEQYEAAARCRDAIESLGKLSQKQKAVASPGTDRDVIGIYENDAVSMLCILRIRDGALNDKLDFPMAGDVIADASAIVSLLFEHYRMSEDVPDKLLLGFDCPAAEMTSLAESMSALHKRRVDVSKPVIGDNKKLCDLACENAKQSAMKYLRDNEKSDEAAVMLASLLSLEVVPYRIEAYDISNIGSENITAGMIVSEGGKFAKSGYRSFKITTTDGQDDYGSLRETLHRRLKYLLPDQEVLSQNASFASTPDLILLDGGANHLSVALEVMGELGLNIPVAGMVKDEFHKTRALVVFDGEEFCEINIARIREVFVFVYKIQEEVHRYSIGRMTQAKRKTVKTSSLTKIDGIGPSKAKILLAAFGGYNGVKNASPEALRSVKGINSTDVQRITAYFGNNTEEEE